MRNRAATILASAAIVVVAVLLGVAVPVVSVFVAVVALNLVLGRRENVPFSMYPMFAEPPLRAWALRFENPAGALVPIARIGMNPFIAKKRFATEVTTARERGIADLGSARRSAAEVLARQLEQHRPARGPLATEPITIVLVEYTLESGSVEKVRTALLETPPR